MTNIENIIVEQNIVIDPFGVCKWKEMRVQYGDKEKRVV